MNKILIPKNPNDSIILPPYVDFRDPAPEPNEALRKALLKHVSRKTPDPVWKKIEDAQRRYSEKQGCQYPEIGLYDRLGIRTEWIPGCPCTACERSKNAGYLPTPGIYDETKQSKQEGQE